MFNKANNNNRPSTKGNPKVNMIQKKAENKIKQKTTSQQNRAPRTHTQ